MPKSFFHHRQHILVATAFGIDQPVRRQPRLGERGSEQIVVLEHPQDGPAAARRNAGDEKGGRSVVVQAGSRAGGLVQRPDRESPAELRIHRRDSERQPLGIARRGGFDGADLRAQAREIGDGKS